MRNIINLLYFTFFILVININYLSAQGCSDPGFCTLYSLKSETDTDTIYKNHMNGGINFGKADHSISTFGMYYSYTREISSRLIVNGKITSIAQSNDAISEFGLSDIFVNATYKFNRKNNMLFGVKLPLSLSDKRLNGWELPMDFQSSLGTVDLIAGYGIIVNDFQIKAAIQIPITNNLNSFIPWFWDKTSDLYNYQQTNNFVRSGDVLLKLSYAIKLSDKFNFVPSVLPIYHIANDKFTETYTGEYDTIEILGSKGLTLNTNLDLNYYVDDRNRFQLSISAPVVTRDSRPDGMGRSILINFDFQYSY